MGRPARARASVKARGGSAQPRLSANVGPATCTDTGDPVPAGVTGGGHQPGKDKEVVRDPKRISKKKIARFFSAVEALRSRLTRRSHGGHAAVDVRDGGSCGADIGAAFIR